MKTEIVTASTGYPILLDTIKDHLRIERGETAENDYLKGLRDAATDQVESITNRKLMTQTWYAYFDDWSADEYIELPYSPLQSVPTTGIVYTNSTSGSTTFGSSAWEADTVSEPGRIVLENSESWPTDILHQRNPIQVKYVVGYGAASTTVPQPIKQAMLLMIGQWHEQRERFH
jgi:uncharacterized phiE125 gp8 family phage protein